MTLLDTKTLSVTVEEKEEGAPTPQTDLSALFTWGGILYTLQQISK